jgi:hypothetical protein
MTPQSKGDQELKKNKPPNTIMAGSQHPKISLYVALLLIEFQDDL